MKPSKFLYINAKTLDEALKALEMPDVKIIAGGQSLVPLMNYRLSQPSTVLDVNSIKELSCEKGWDGTHYQTNNDLPMGVYIYQIYYQDFEGWKHQETSELIITR